VRWIRIREAKLDQFYRQLFEELGVEIVRAYFTQDIGVVVYKNDAGERWTVANLREHMKPWLREQYDIQERRESWNLTMEVAITLFVALELGLSFYSLWHGCR
jgi:hypothetical protein